MPGDFLKTPIEYLKGVGPNRAELLKKELNVFTFEDLLLHFPFRYVDRSRFYKINSISDDLPYVQIVGKLTRLEKVGPKKGGRLIGNLQDDTGSLELVWFKGTKWIGSALELNKIYVVFGKPTSFNNRYNIVHPEMELQSEFKKQVRGGLHAVYPATEKLNNQGLNSKAIQKLQQRLVSQLTGKIPETLSSGLLKEHQLMDKESALKQLHMPQNSDTLAKAQYRIKFEELFFIQLKLLVQKLINEQKLNGYRLAKIGDLFNTFYNQHLEFELTDAQKRVVKEIRADVNTGQQMNRLLQGDVGSGKTVVAVMAILMAIDNGFQACVMAPTELLAKQHFETISAMLAEVPVKVELLTGSTRSAKRKVLHEGLLNGSIHLLIGTHALTEDPVRFQNLGLAVIDEQHRFGVAQRAKLWKKNHHPPHVLVMTATPIPRTLAMTLYGDLDVSVIDELPKGRKPIKTIHRFDSARLRVFGFIEQEIAKGRQIYIVYPLIKESEKLDYKDLMDGYESISRRFPAPDYRLSIVHGQMKAADKDFEMERFVKGETQIMVATTVIEVGINVPNASVMIIESAERFGLSQLHQLRGRVGRGADQSYCILMTSHKLSADGKLRMETMVNSTDGFEIAEVDLKLRGPGDLHGTQQSGLPFGLRLANLSKDGPLVQLCRHAAIKLLKHDPKLEKEEHLPIKKQYQKHIRSNADWGRIL